MKDVFQEPEKDLGASELIITFGEFLQFGEVRVRVKDVVGWRICESSIHLKVNDGTEPENHKMQLGSEDRAEDALFHLDDLMAKHGGREVLLEG